MDSKFCYNLIGLFAGCSSLKTIPDISNWNLKKTNNLALLFYGCSSLISLPDISKWNTKNILNLNSIFENCSLLTYIPNISNWKFNYKIIANYIFKGCDSLLIIPDISKWNINLFNWPNNLSDKTESTLSLDNLKSSDLSNDLLSFKENNDFNLFKNNISIENSIDNSGNEDLDDYYDNFYN